MRDIKPAIRDAWLSGDFSGDRRNVARVTVQQGKLKHHQFGYNYYTSLPFGPDTPPKELPNVRSVSWERDAQAEIASCTVTFFNTEPLPLGTQGAPDLDQPGYFTFNRGGHEFSKRWNHTRNEWSKVLMPDNILRTYEGYGYDENVAPEFDPHLMQTGVWMIDTVEYQTDGTITVSCRDVGRILVEQMLFPPITPKHYYPLSFTRDTVAPGFIPGRTYTKVVTAGGDFDQANPPPGGWTGPTVAPNIAYNGDQDNAASIRVGPYDCYQACVPAEGQPQLYAVDGFEVVVDNIRYPKLYQIPNVPEAEPRTIQIPDLMNGNVYLIEAVAIYREINTGRRVTSSRSINVWATPRERSQPHARVVLDSILRDTDEDGNVDLGETHPGQLVWRYIESGVPTTWRIIFYKTVNGRLVREVEEHLTLAGTAGEEAITTFQTARTEPGNTLSDWNILVYPTNGVQEYINTGPFKRALSARAVGGGGLAFKPSGGEFYAPPTPGFAPQEAPPPDGPVGYTGGVPIPVQTSTSRARPAYHNSSNDYYDGSNDRDVHGHNPRHSFDGNPSTYFLSVGNSNPGRGFAFEWNQGSLPGSTISQVHFSTVKAGYHAYISVFAHGRWVVFNDGDVIPYNASLPESHNAGNIPFCAQVGVPNEGPHTVTLKQPIPGATLVRVTLRNLQNFGIGPYYYRGAIREIEVTTFAQSGGGTTEKVPVSVGPVVDVTSPTVVSTYTVTEPPRVEPGVGQKAGRYHDYTDIVKLFCAWAGFFWPAGGVTGETAEQRLSRYVRQIRAGEIDLNFIRAEVDRIAGKNPPYQPLPVPEENDAPYLADDQMLRQRIMAIFSNRGVALSTARAAGGPAVMYYSDGTSETFDIGKGPYGFQNYDPVLGEDAGRVWGDFAQTGTGGVADLDSGIWDKKSLLDGIVYIREIIGHLFFIDETGAPVWKAPNIFSVGNDVATLSKEPRRTTDVIELHDDQQLLALTVKLDQKNVRERVFIASSDGTASGLAVGWNPNPIGLRRVTGWTDMGFENSAEAKLMADWIALRQLMTYRTNSLTIPANPAIQVNDQVRIFERVTEEGFYHYVNTITSENNMEEGGWTYGLKTTWLGEKPFDEWLFSPFDLSEETKGFLEAIGLLPGNTPLPPKPGEAPAPLPPPDQPALQIGDKVSIYVRVDGDNRVYITDGIVRRHVTNEAERVTMAALGIVPTAKVQFVSRAILDAIPIIDDAKDPGV